MAGLVGEVANNGIGGSGVAPDATLISYRMAFGPDFTYAQPILAFERALAAGADVVNNSWGADAAFLQNAANPALAPFYTALNTLGSEGRDGNGTIVVFANGNGGRSNFDSMLNNVLNSKYVIAVAATENNGLQTQYSTPGTNLLVSAPAGRSTNQADDRPGNGVLTTDRTSTDGYNKNAGVDGDYAYNFNGTSAASPITSGVVALILDANPDLGYHDVQEILAHSARFVDTGGTAWTTPAQTAGTAAARCSPASTGSARSMRTGRFDWPRSTRSCRTLPATTATRPMPPPATRESRSIAAPAMWRP